jgi:hypothetical protein
MSIRIRAARIDDIAAIVPFIRQASGGISDFLLRDVVDGMSVNELIEMALTDENTVYHFSQCIVAEQANQLIGVTHFYPSAQHALSDLMLSMISQDKLDIIAPYFSSFVPDSLYVHIMAVAESHRTALGGVLMGKKIDEIARFQQAQCLSAHVWQANDSVFQGLKTLDFKPVQSFTLKPQPEFLYSGAMLLMKGPDFR